jgi:hypothetical protein
MLRGPVAEAMTPRDRPRGRGESMTLIGRPEAIRAARRFPLPKSRAPTEIKRAAFPAAILNN